MITTDGRNIDAMRAAVADFHRRFHPPRVDDDDGESYWAAWAAEAQQIMKRYDCDPFIMDELEAVEKELTREWRLIRAQEGAGYGL